MSSNNNLMLDVSQAAELKLAFRRNGWNNTEIKTLSEGDILADILKVIKGQAEIKIIEHLIDCDSAPLVPNDWSVEDHKKGGMFKFNPEKISLYLSKKQEKRRHRGKRHSEIIGKSANFKRQCSGLSIGSSRTYSGRSVFLAPSIPLVLPLSELRKVK